MLEREQKMKLNQSILLLTTLCTYQSIRSMNGEENRHKALKDRAEFTKFTELQKEIYPTHLSTLKSPAVQKSLVYGSVTTAILAYGKEALTKALPNVYRGILDDSAEIRIIANDADSLWPYALGGFAAWWLWSTYKTSIVQMALVNQSQEDFIHASDLLCKAHTEITRLKKNEIELQKDMDETLEKIETLEDTIGKICKQSEHIEDYQRGIITLMHKINEQFAALKKEVDELQKISPNKPLKEKLVTVSEMLTEMKKTAEKHNSQPSFSQWLWRRGKHKKQTSAV